MTRVLLKDATTKYPIELMLKQSVSHDSYLYRFRLESEEHILGIPLGKHVNLSAEINGELVSRAYTPISLNDQKGYLDFVLKVCL